MIDELPLHVFGEDDDAPAPAAVPAPAAPEAATPPDARCQFCGAAAAPDAQVCPACGGRLRPLGAPAGEVAAGAPLECQWCDAPLPEGATTCPACGSRVADPSLQLLGLTTPRPSDEFVYASRPAIGYFGPSTELTSDLTLLVARTLLRAFLGR